MTLTVLQQLQELKWLTVRMGTIHDAQQIQLRNYGRLVDGIARCTVAIDIEQKMVSYTLMPGDPSWRFNEDRFRECRNITTHAVRTILWDDTVVLFKVDSEVVYDSRNDSEVPRDVSADRK